MRPWLDRSGQLSPLKLLTFLFVLMPGTWTAFAWSANLLGPKPVTEAIHETGLWGVRLLLLCLAVTPLRRIADWPKLIQVRRMLGLAAFGYLVVHLGLYCLDQRFDLARVASEIASRIYLTIGFSALVGLSILAATSTDAAIRRLGKRWNTLHRLVYLLAALGLVHFFMQSKIDVTEAVLMAGLFALLMGHRLMHRLGIATTPLSLVGLAAAGGLATALIETAWYELATGVPALRVLAANLDFSIVIRPAWWVFLTGLGLVLVNLVRRRSPGRKAGLRRVIRDPALT